MICQTVNLMINIKLMLKVEASIWDYKLCFSKYFNFAVIIFFHALRVNFISSKISRFNTLINHLLLSYKYFSRFFTLRIWTRAHCVQHREYLIMSCQLSNQLFWRWKKHLFSDSPHLDNLLITFSQIKWTYYIRNLHRIISL